MNADAARRFGRQIALSQVGPDGQDRICRARVVVAGGDLAAEVAARYLRAAGVGAVVEIVDAPADGAGWLAALDGADVLVRSGFDDDAMFAVATRLGLPAVVVRALPGGIDLASRPRRPPAPEAPLDIPVRPAPRTESAPAVAAGAIAAAEALQVLVGADRSGGFARHLRLPLDGGEPLVQVIGGP
jgi:hypothetical protein